MTWTSLAGYPIWSLTRSWIFSVEVSVGPAFMQFEYTSCQHNIKLGLSLCIYKQLWKRTKLCGCVVTLHYESPRVRSIMKPSHVLYRCLLKMQLFNMKEPALSDELWYLLGHICFHSAFFVCLTVSLILQVCQIVLQTTNLRLQGNKKCPNKTCLKNL